MLFKIYKDVRDGKTSAALTLTFIAASLYDLDAIEVVSYLASRSRPVAAMVAADESAGRGAGIKGALKSLKYNMSLTAQRRQDYLTNQGTIPSPGILSRKYLAKRRDVTR
jgi:hypothetical protein